MSQRGGTVKWFNNTKGYGLLGLVGGKDVFIHYTSIQKTGYKSFKEGDQVVFDVIQGAKGPQADQSHYHEELGVALVSHWVTSRYVG